MSTRNPASVGLIPDAKNEPPSAGAFFHGVTRVSMKYYLHHIGDFDRATRHLSRIERSVYSDNGWTITKVKVPGKNYHRFYGKAPKRG